MRRLVAAAAVLFVVVLPACGSSDGGDVARVQPWDDRVPYLPPRAATAQEAARVEEPGADAAPAGAEAEAVEETLESGAPTDDAVRRELREAFKGSSGSTGDLVDRASLTPQGLATIPPSAPRRLAAMINAANQVARRPYVYGGGHGGGDGPEGLFTDTGYDCSGSVSYALASAGFIESPMASGPLMTFGEPGPGKWVTIYASPSHAYMVVAGLRFDTSGRAKSGSRWQADQRPGTGMTVRHPPGL